MSGLDRLWGLLHHSLLLQAGADGAKLDSDPVTRSRVKARAPASGAVHEVIELERRWAGARSNTAKRAVLRDVWAAVEAHTTPNADPRSLRGTREWREVVGRDPRPSRTVAKMYGLSKSTVLRYRAELKHSPPDGP